ncbi:MAG: DUF262 domain-containing protein [Pseudomonadota bacterium]
MQKPLETHCLSVEALFAFAKQYELPWYQRVYAWDVEHAVRLVQDVRARVEQNTPWYPLGQIISAHVGVDTADALSVVDGQQRITTLTILFAVLRDLVSDDPATQARLNALIFDQTGDVQRPRVAVTLEPMQITLRERVLGDGATAIEGSDDDPLMQHESCAHVVRNMQEMRAVIEAMDLETRQRFAAYLLDNCFVTLTVVIDGPEAAASMFQLTHIRGLKLIDTDLFKVTVLDYIADPESRDACANTWDSWRTQLGAESFRTLLELIQQMALKREGQQLLEIELTQHYRLQEAHATERFVHDVVAPCAGALHALLTLSVGEGDAAFAPVNRRVQYLQLLDHVGWRAPAVLWLARHRDRLDAAEALAFFRNLEASATLMDLGNHDRRQRMQRYYRLCEAIETGDEAEILTAAAPTPSIIAKGVEQLRYDNFGRKTRVNGYLRRIDGSIAGDHAVASFKTATIEHVIPKAAMKKGTVWAPKRSVPRAIVQALGNLTVLTLSENHDAGAKTFTKKRVVYQGSVFAMSRVLGEAERWDEAAVKARTQALIETLMTSWGLVEEG